MKRLFNIALIVLCLSSTHSFAAQTSYDFEATITDSYVSHDMSNTYIPAYSIGDSYNGYFSYDPDTFVEIPDVIANTQSYMNSSPLGVLGLLSIVNGLSLQTDPLAVDSVEAVVINNGGSNADRLLFDFDLKSYYQPNKIIYVRLSFKDTSEAVFNDASFPGTIDFSHFDEMTFSVVELDIAENKETAHFIGVISSLTPAANRPANAPINPELQVSSAPPLSDNSAIGSTQTRLTNSPDLDGAPSFSPDGSKIVFISNRSGNPDIWVMDSDGSSPTQLTTAPDVDTKPHWNHDGTQIVYRSFRGGNANTWIMNSDGTSQTQLTFDTVGTDSFVKRHGADWNHDSSQIAFDSRRSGSYDIYVMSPDGTGQTPLTSDPQDETQPCYSPDGSQIVYMKLDTHGYNNIWIMDSDGGNQRPLTSQDYFHTVHPHWSPDGSKVIFSKDFVGNYEVAVKDVATGYEYQISHNPALDGGGYFSPDGKKVVFRSERTGDSEIWVYDYESAYVSKLNTMAVDCPPGVTEPSVNIVVTSGQTRTHTTTGLIEGPFLVTIDHMIDISDGTHQGWRSLRASYDMGGYIGTIYKTVDPLGNGWGKTTGDIHAAIRSDASGNREWYVTSINGQQVDGQILVSDILSTTPATTTTPLTTTQAVRTGFKWSGASTGYYKGPLTNEVSVVAFPALQEGGFAYGTYSSDIGTGSSWAYLDNRDANTIRRYVSYDGALFGHGMRQWPVASYSCYDLAATQRYEHVLAPGLPVDPSYQAGFDNSIVSSEQSIWENVDVTIFEGYSNTTTATGALSGTRTMQLRKRVDIHTGTYAGWHYKVHTYELNGHRGTTYIISDGIRGWGYATGDINAVIDGGASTWYLTSIKGVPTVGVIEFSGLTINAGTRTDYYGLGLRITRGTHEVAYTGLKSGINSFDRTAVVIPSLGDGFVHGTYVSPWGSGEAYLYLDNNNAPIMFRKGVATGPLLGTRDIKGTLPFPIGSTAFEGLWEFVLTDTDGDGTIDSDDLDDDNDGLSDVVEITYNLNPLDPADATEDPDGDGLTNLQEIQLGYSISLADTDGDGVNDNIDNCPTIANADQADVCSGTSEVSEIPTPPNPVVSAPPTVTVAPTPDVEITIEEVQTGGTVTVTPMTVPDAPANIKIVGGASYEISTDVNYGGNITVCLGYNGALVGDEDKLQLMHYEGGWVDITTTRYPGIDRICGETSSLSPFAVGEETTSAPTSTSTGVPIMNGWWLLAALGGGVTLLRRRKN